MRHSGRSELPRALRLPYGLAVLGVGSSTGGALTIALLAWLNGAPYRFGVHGTVLAVTAGAYTVFAMVTGVAASVVLQRRAVRPLRTAAELTPGQAALVRRLPARMTVLGAVLWTLGVAGNGVLMLVLLDVRDAFAGIALGALGGLAATAFVYLIVERAIRPVMPAVLAAYQGRRGHVLARLAVTWALTGGLPLSYVILALTYTRSAPDDRIRATLVIAGAGLLLGAATTGLLARAVATPLRRMRRSLERVARGDLDVSVDVNDPSEIGLLQSSVNDLVRGLRERERIRAEFGRHVGDPVVERAMSVGSSRSGDTVDVAALFVDVADSTALAHRLPAGEFVDKLNRLLDDVVAVTDRHGGLVNKFEGDAALCVYGAPVRLADPATAALRAAREIRDAVMAAGELDVGIGVTLGPVFAGHLGTSTRLEYTVIGDAVHEAARLTDAAKQVPGRVLASAAAIEHAEPGERERWTEHGPIELRGRADPTTSWTNGRCEP